MELPLTLLVTTIQADEATSRKIQTSNRKEMFFYIDGKLVPPSYRQHASKKRASQRDYLLKENKRKKINETNNKAEPKFHSLIIEASLAKNKYKQKYIQPVLDRGGREIHIRKVKEITPSRRSRGGHGLQHEKRHMPQGTLTTLMEKTPSSSKRTLFWCKIISYGQNIRSRPFFDFFFFDFTICFFLRAQSDI